MKCFTPDTGSFAGKINYVDRNNRVLGYDMDADCCEQFGHRVCFELPTSEAVMHDDSPEPDIAAYDFSSDQPVEIAGDWDSGGALGFRIVAKGLPDLWVCIWNHHNGYYSHGWVVGENGKPTALCGHL